MKENEKALSVQINADLLRKFDYVARYNDRSINGMMVYLVKRFVKAFEEKYGKIEFDEAE